jgi:DNA polymerase-1
MASRASHLYLVDISSYIFRAFHAIPPLNNKNGLPTNATLGVVNMLLKLVNEERPEAIAIVFDAGGPTFRDEISDDYKANRHPTPEALRPQLPYVRKVIEAFRLHCLEVPGVEADDVIATLARSFASPSNEVVIVTGDKDLMQLVGPQVSLYMPSGGRGGTLEPRRVGRGEVEQRFGVPPEKVVEVMALTGDSIDNIPGVKGIGDKTAQTLIRAFGSVDELLARVGEVENLGLRGAKRVRELLESQAESARTSRELARLKTDVPVEVTLDDLRMQAPDYVSLRALFTELGFQSKIPLVAPREATKSGTTGWIETKAELALFAKTLATKRRIALESIETKDRSLQGLAVATEESEAYVITLGGEIRAADLAPWLGSAEIGKIGADLKRVTVLLAREGVALRGAELDVGVASYVVNPSRQSHRVEDLALEYLGRALITGLEDSEHGVGEAAAERARSILRIAAVLREKLAEQEAERLFEQIEMPLVTVLARMELRGVRIDTQRLAAMSAELDGRMRTLLAEIYALADGEFNVHSPPQLREVLFEKLRISPRGVRRGKTGFSTDVDVLTRLAREHPLPQKILDFRSFAKLKSTYVDALPALVDPTTRRIHCSFNQTVAATGRLSSSDPNLQNIPIRTEEGRRIRQAFLPAPGQRLISADYSQIELRVLAHVTADATLISAFRNREDVHVRTAAEVFHVDSALVSAEQRRAAKVINFGILYGMGPSRLSKELGISFEEAQTYIESYFARYPGVQKYVESTLEGARKTGFVTTLLGRRRFIPDLTSTEGGVRQFAERTAVNTPIQGTAADLIKAAMVAIDRRLTAAGSGAGIILQVHDELILEAPEAEVDAVAALVREEMEGAAHLSVPLEVAVGVGSSWAEIH